MSAIVPRVDPSSAVAVTSYLEQAKTWLATAVEQTGPEQIARAKAEIATAAEAAKQLNLSREIQDDAQEMVRRAEYALSKSIRKGQADGSVATRGKTSHGEVLASPSRFASESDLYSAKTTIHDLSDAVEPEHFDAALDAAKAEGNLSRANVARKAQEISGKPRKSPRRPLVETSRHAGLDLMTAVERVERILNDDRFRSEAEQVTPQMRNHLNSAIETLTGLLERINNN